MAKIAADAPIRWWLFMRIEKNRLANDAIYYCPCGTNGSCMVCDDISEWLYSRWFAVLHPFRFVWTRMQRKVWWY